MINSLYDYLLENGIDVYFIGQHKGECTSKYVVLKNDGTTGENNKVGKGYIDILFFVPQDYPSQCEEFKRKVKLLIKDFNKLRYSANETGEVIDEEKKAITFSVMYEVLKKLEG